MQLHGVLRLAGDREAALLRSWGIVDHIGIAAESRLRNLYRKGLDGLSVFQHLKNRVDHFCTVLLSDAHIILKLQAPSPISGIAITAAVIRQGQQHGKVTVTGDLLPAGLTAGGDIRREGHFAGLFHRQVHRGGEHAAAPGHRQLRGLAVLGHHQRHLRVRRPTAEGDAHVGLQRMTFRVKAGGFKGKIRQILRLLPLLRGQVRDPLIHIGKPPCDTVQLTFQDRLRIYQLRPGHKQSNQ